MLASCKLRVGLIIICLILQVNSYGQSDIDIMGSFKQGTVKGGGNCVSIALIKASYSKFGLDELFQKIDTTQTGYEVVMRDTSTVNFTFEELEMVSKMAGFRQLDTTRFAIEFKEFAEFCFTAMGKRLVQLESEREIDLNVAIDSLNDGYSTPDAYKLLGVKFKRINCQKVRSLEELENLVVYNGYHAVYASRGFYDESSTNYPLRLVKFQWNRFGPKCFFERLCAVKEAFQIAE
ncbi:hypothetical protein [Ekhidna sp.]